MDITVIVPCFNSEKTLKRCLDSLLKQTMPVIIFVINDGSCDCTQEIANRYAAQYPNVKVYSQENKGLPKTRLAGLQRVSTKYVGFVDSDDWVDEEMFETLHQLSEKYHSEISACGMTWCNKKTKRRVQKEYCINGVCALSILHTRKGINASMCNKLFLTEFAKKLLFSTGNIAGEDYMTLTSRIEKANQVAVTNLPLYHYIMRFDSMCHRGYDEQKRKSLDNYIELYDRYSQGHSAEQCAEMRCYLCDEYLGIYASMIRNSNYDSDAIAYITQFFSNNKALFLKNSIISLRSRASVWMVLSMPWLFRLLYKFYNQVLMTVCR